MDLKRELLGVVGALNRSEVPYALCGGMAVVLHGHPRLTRDVDLLIRKQDLEAAEAALATAGFTLPGGMLPFDPGGRHERNVFRLSKRVADDILADDILTVDLLLLPDFLRDVWEDREVYELDGVPVTVVSADGLIAMKRVAGRHQDLSDIEHLERAREQGR